MLRASSYLNRVDVGNGSSLLISGSTLCIDRVPTDYAQGLTEGRDLSFLRPDETQHLLKRGHLTALTRKDELKEFKKLVGVVHDKRAKLDQKQQLAGVSFILTYNCNLSCTYCYQKSLAEKSGSPTMSGEFIDRFFSDYYRQLFPRSSRKLFITLFGGEPLLPPNREAIERILAYARKRPSVRIHVSTNATTLKRMADLISPGKGRIQTVQITLDGDRPHHDKSRVYPSGKPTFDATIAAIRRLIELKVHVSLRIHIHHQMLESTERLIEQLEKEKILGHPQVGIYFSPINTFSSEKMTKEEADLFGRLFQYVAVKTGQPPSNLDFLDRFLDMQAQKILPKTRFCGTGSDSFYVIDPLGDIYGCYEEAGHRERRIGSLSDGKVTFRPLQTDYSKRHLLNLPECITCSAALFCGGGCPSEARIQKGSMFKSFCHQNKAYIEQTLKAFYLKKEVEA